MARAKLDRIDRRILSDLQSNGRMTNVELAYSVSVFALVGLNSQAEADLKSFEALIANWDEVRECHMLAGEADFLLKIVAETWDDYQKFLTTRLTSAPNVSHVKSMMVFRTAKEVPGVPISTEA